MLALLAFSAALTLSQPVATERIPTRERSPLPSPVIGQGWGVNLGFGDLKPLELDLMRAGGVAWVRRDLFWHEIETEKGKYQWTAWDKLLAQIEPRGIRPVFILCYGNGLYQEGAPTTPEARAAFVRYVLASIERYQGRGVVWEMWNEPNNHHWQPRPNVQDYVALAREVGKAVKKRFPNEWLAMPAVAGFDWAFIRACLDAGLLDLYDAVTVHPYRPMEPESAAPDYAQLRATLARYAKGRDIPILSGEWGYSAATGMMTEQAQGAYTVRQYLGNLASGVPVSIWYNWTNNGVRPGEIIDNFGVLRQDFTPKAGFEQMRRLSQNLDGFALNKRLAVGGASDWALLFERDGQVGLALWSTARRGRTLLAPWSGKEISLGSEPMYEKHAAPGAWLRQASAWAALPASAVVGTPEDAWRLLQPVLRTLPDDARLEIEDGGPWRTWPAGIRESDALSALASLPRLTDRSETPRALRVRARFADSKWAPMAQEVLTLHPEPLRLALSVAEGDSLAVSIEAVHGSFAGKLRVFAAGNPSERDVSVTAAKPALEQFASKPAATGVRAELVDAGGKVVAKTPVLRFQPIDIGPDALVASLDGDPKVGGDVQLTRISGPEPALRIAYQFSAGWRYAEVKPREPKLLGQQASRLGMWVKGDGSGAELRMRYTDATGQTFQPDAGTIDWEGWRFITYSLRGDASGRWGGMNDGIVYWPIRITTLALLDNPGGRGVRGSIEIRGAVVMTED